MSSFCSIYRYGDAVAISATASADPRYGRSEATGCTVYLTRDHAKALHAQLFEILDDIEECPFSKSGSGSHTFPATERNELVDVDRREPDAGQTAMLEHLLETGELKVEERPHHPDCPATDGGGCRCDGTQMTDRITRSAPAWAWDLIDETLAMDAQSSAFDAELRQRISDAHDAIVEDEL